MIPEAGDLGNGLNPERALTCRSQPHPGYGTASWRISLVRAHASSLIDIERHRVDRLHTTAFVPLRTRFNRSLATDCSFTRIKGGGAFLDSCVLATPRRSSTQRLLRISRSQALSTWLPPLRRVPP